MADEKPKGQFISNIKKELKKVIWPTKEQTAKNTLAVIVIVFLVSFIVIVFDFLLVKGNDFVIDKSTGGKITQYKQDTQRKSDILKEMQQYADAETMQTYNQIAYYLSVEDLEKILEDLKNPKPPEDENGTDENTGNQEGNNGEENNTTQE